MYAHDPFLWLNANVRHAWLDPVFGVLTDLANGWYTAIVVLFALLWVEKKRGFSVFFAAGLASLVGFAASQALKAWLNTPRPLAYFEQSIQRGEVVIHVVGDPLFTNSFPSGHATAASAFGVYLVLVYGAKSWWVGVLAVLGAYSRVYVGAHFLIDVVAGFLLGSAMGWLGFVFARRQRWLPNARQGGPATSLRAPKTA